MKRLCVGNGEEHPTRQQQGELNANESTQQHCTERCKRRFHPQLQHHLKPGDWVLIKDHWRKHWKQRRYTGPFQVPLTTETAVRWKGKRRGSTPATANASRIQEAKEHIHLVPVKGLQGGEPSPTAVFQDTNGPSRDGRDGRDGRDDGHPENSDKRQISSAKEHSGSMVGA
ncbi:uncharacterized protein LOC144391208 [Gasterosteus aculeatus]